MRRNTDLRRLIGDIVAKLEEGPGMPLVAMFASNRCSLPNPAQVFESDCLARYGSFEDKLLADTVIGSLGLALELPQLQVEGTRSSSDRCKYPLASNSA
jgi:hypothetical protein